MAEIPPLGRNRSHRGQYSGYRAGGLRPATPQTGSGSFLTSIGGTVAAITLLLGGGLAWMSGAPLWVPLVASYTFGATILVLTLTVRAQRVPS